MHVMDKFFSNMKLNKKIKNSCQVLIISPGKGIYDYKVNNKIEIGQIVTVPLRKKFYQGIVLDRGTRGFPVSKLKITFNDLFYNYKKIVEKFSIDEKKALFSKTAITTYNIDQKLLHK